YQALFGGNGPTGSALARSFRGVRSFSAFSGSADVNIFSPHHYLAFGFNHPLFLVLSLSLAVSVGASSLAGDIEMGRSEFLHARPIGRTSLLVGRVAVWAVAEIAMLIGAGCGAFVGSRLSADMRHGGVGHLGAVVPQALTMTAFFAALGFFVSTL